MTVVISKLGTFAMGLLTASHAPIATTHAFAGPSKVADPFTTQPSAKQCPESPDDTYSNLLTSADELAEEGKNLEAARTFVSAFDTMGLADKVGGAGGFAADRAFDVYWKAWEDSENPAILTEAEEFFTDYLDHLQSGRLSVCPSVNEDTEANVKLTKIRGAMPEPEPEDKEVIHHCPQPEIEERFIDRWGVGLVAAGGGLTIAGIALMAASTHRNIRDRDSAVTGFLAGGGVTLGLGITGIIVGAIRLGVQSPRRSRGYARYLTPQLGPGEVGIGLAGRF